MEQREVTINATPITDEESRRARPFAIEVLRELGVCLSEDDRDAWLRALIEAIVEAARYSAILDLEAEGGRMLAAKERGEESESAPAAKPERETGMFLGEQIRLGRRAPAPLPADDEAGLEEEAMECREACWGDGIKEQWSSLRPDIQESWLRVARAARAMRAKEREEITRLDDVIDDLRAKLSAAERENEHRRLMGESWNLVDDLACEGTMRPGEDPEQPVRSILRAKVYDAVKRAEAAERERDEARAEVEKWRGAASVLCGAHVGIKFETCPACAAGYDTNGITQTALRTAPPAQALDVEALAKEIEAHVWDEGMALEADPLRAILRKHLRPCPPPSVLHTVDIEKAAQRLCAGKHDPQANEPRVAAILRDCSRAVSVEEVERAILGTHTDRSFEPLLPAYATMYAESALSAIGLALAQEPRDGRAFVPDWEAIRCAMKASIEANPVLLEVSPATALVTFARAEYDRQRAAHERKATDAGKKP